MVGNLLLRGMMVGVIAGLLAFSFARVFGEPQIDRAIAFETQMAQAKGEAPEPELVSRATQAGLGLFTACVVYSAAVGGLFSLVFAFAYGRVGELGPRALAAVLALCGFIAVVFVPGLKYPPNPPSVGLPATIGMRTALFFSMLALSIAAMSLAVTSAVRLRQRYGLWNAVLWAGLGFIVAITIVQYALPSINEVPRQFSADVLWRFRLASFGMQAVLWTTLGLVFGVAAERLFGGVRPRRIAEAYARRL